MKRTRWMALLICATLAPWAWAQTSRPAYKLRSWKLYRNLKYGFQFRYPQHFSVVENGPDPNEELFLAGLEISGTQPPLLDSVDVMDRKGRRVFTVAIPDQKNFPVVTPSYGWSLRACGEIGFAKITLKRKIIFAGYRTLKVSSDYTRYYCIDTPHQPFIIHYNAKAGAAPVNILSTFTFLK